MRATLKVMVRWALSPLATPLYTVMLAASLLIAGAEPSAPLFWLTVAIFLGVAAFYDISAYVVQRRKGLTSTQVADAVFERLWPAREESGRR
jgi:hypothetical protein